MTLAPSRRRLLNGSKTLAKKPEPNQPLDFEQALGRLEVIVHELEEGEIGLGESLNRYEQGVALLRQCHKLLRRAERRIELLSGVDAEGKPISTPLDDRSLTLDEKAQRRRRRRSAPEAVGPCAGGGDCRPLRGRQR